jgi:hypothetical protein
MQICWQKLLAYSVLRLYLLGLIFVPMAVWAATNPLSQSSSTGGGSSNAPQTNQQGAANPPATQPIFWPDPGSFRNWIVDGTSAIFGILSVTIALVVLYLALRGLHDYRALKAQLVEEVRRDVTKEIVDKLINDAIAGIRARVNDEADALQKRVLEQAEKRLSEESLKMANDVAQRDEFRAEISQRVAAILAPEMKPTTPDEFEPPTTA